MSTSTTTRPGLMMMTSPIPVRPHTRPDLSPPAPRPSTNPPSRSDSEISNESDFDPSEETLLDRLFALRDVVSPTTRGWIASRVGEFSSTAWTVLSFSGKGAWVVTTSALFFGVPWALSFAEDQQLTAMEEEFNMRQTGGELLTAGTEQSTADMVGAAIGDEKAKPAL